MQTLVEWGLANASTAAILAVCVAVITRVWRNPHLAHWLWLIVLLRLVAPPVVRVPLPTFQWRGSHGVSARSGAALDVPDVSIAKSSTGHRAELRQLTALGPILTPTARRLEPSLPTTPSTQTAGPTGRTGAVAEGASGRELSSPVASSIPVWDVLAAIWIAGSVLYVALSTVRVRRFAQAVRRSAATPPGWLEAEIGEMARTVGLRRIPRVSVIEWTLPPMVWSGIRPMLLVPQALIESMDPAQRQLLLQHELLHIRRRDPLARWFAIAVFAVYWWNPIAWWSVRKLQNAQEECCDATVLSLDPQQSKTYGEALLAVSEFVSCGSLPAAAVSVGVERKNHLKRRMSMILAPLAWKQLSKTHIAGIVGCGAVVLGISLTTAAAQVNPTPEINATKDEPKLAAPQPQKRSTAVSGTTTTSAKQVSAPQPSRPVASTAAPPSTPKPPAFLRYTALELRPTDDETQNILKQRYNAAVRSVQLYEYQYDINKTPLGNVLAAARNLLEAKRALGKNSEDETRALEDYLEFVTYSWRLAKDRLDIGGATGFSPLDEAQAREAMFDAKLKVAQLVSREKAKPPGTTQPVLPAAGFSPRHAAAFVQSLQVRVRIADAEVAAARAVAQQAEVELKRAMTNLKYREAQLGRVQAARKVNGVGPSDVDEATHLRDDAVSSVDAARAVLAAAEAQGVIKVAQSEQVALELKQAQEAVK